MSKSFNVITGILLTISCAACGGAAMTPQLRRDAELRTIILDETPRAWMHDTNSFFEDPASARALRLVTDDAGLQDTRATRSGWAASDAR